MKEEHSNRQLVRHRLVPGLVPVITILLLVSLLTSSCGAAQEEVVDLAPDLAKAQQELESAKAQLATVKTQVSVLTSELENTRNEQVATRDKYAELSAKYDEVKSNLETLQAKYDELLTKYEAVIREAESINEENIEQAIFEVINQERRDNGLNELAWHDGLYWWAQQHSQYMATKKRLEYADNNYMQGIFRAAGYSTVDEITNAALIIWQESLQYEQNFLYVGAINGAVAVSKAREIFYITYFADIY